MDGKQSIIELKQWETLIMLKLPMTFRLCTLPLLILSLTAYNTFRTDSATTADAIDHQLPAIDLEASGKLDALEDKIAKEIHQPTEIVHEDIWERIRNGYQLPDIDNAQIDTHLKWYSSHQAHIDRFTERSQRYLHYVVSEMEANDMPLELALLPIVKSSYDPFAYSRSKAAGIWQFVPGTGRSFGLKQNWWYDGRRDIVASTDAAIRYLQRLHNMFDGDWLLALAAYNSGEGRVGRAIRKNKQAGKPTNFWSLPLPKETRSYVPRLLALSKIVATPEAYKVTLQTVPNDPYFTRINIDTQIDLLQVARLADIDIKELQHLNAGYSRWLTDPSGSHHLLVPVADAANFTSQLSNLPQLPPISWSEHTVVKGDVLGSIAQRHKTTVDAIKSVNRLRNNNIRIGQKLLVPSAKITLGDHVTSEELMQNYGKKIVSSATQQYVVRPGDSLWKIANRHNTSVAALTRLNNISSNSRLKPGQKLIVNGNYKPTVVATDDGIHKMTYHIRHGDTLGSIASRFNLTTKDILSWNKVKDVHYIHPGQALTLYVNAADI